MKRKSLQREIILRIIRNTHSHPRAVWVYEQVKETIPNISLGTIYRNLRLLTQEKQIQELKSPNHLSRYDGNCIDHYHFRCEKCGNIFDLDQAVDHAIEKTIAEKTGFIVTNHSLEFTGKCSACRNE
jgi:Fur family transcriptional regulator, peroxide stress response regulator